MELTQEYFDKVMSAMFEQVADIRSDMVTNNQFRSELKVALDKQSDELKDYVHEAFEAQQVWIDTRFDELITKHDVRDRVTRLEKDVAQLKLKIK